MYARFLREVASISAIPAFNNIADAMHKSDEVLTEIANLFKDAQQMGDIPESITAASGKLSRAADIKGGVFTQLSEIV